MPPLPPDASYYDKGSFSAALYDIVESVLRPAAPEIAFYRSLAETLLDGKPDCPILDLGAGTGRIALPLAMAGHEVHALELSEAMLAVAEGKRSLCPPSVAERLRFRQGDMRDFDMGQFYELAVVPFRVFNFLLTPQDQAAFLTCLRRHLTLGGHAAIDTLGWRPGFSDASSSDPSDGTARNGVTIALPGTDYIIDWSVAEQSLDPERRVAASSVRYAVVNGAGVTLRAQTETLRMRWTEPSEFQAQAKSCGLRVVAEYGGFDRRPAEGPGDRLWLVAPA